MYDSAFTLKNLHLEFSKPLNKGLDVVIHLIDSGADPKAVNKDGNTALSLARSNRDEDVVKILEGI